MGRLKKGVLVSFDGCMHYHFVSYLALRMSWPIKSGDTGMLGKEVGWTRMDGDHGASNIGRSSCCIGKFVWGVFWDQLWTGSCAYQAKQDELCEAYRAEQYEHREYVWVIECVKSL